MSYLLYVMLAATGRSHIPVLPVFQGSREGMDPAIVAILDLVFPGQGEKILDSLIFTNEAGTIKDLKGSPQLVQVDSSGYQTWLTLDHHEEKRNTQAGPGSRIIPGASAAFLISQEYHKLRKAGFQMWTWRFRRSKTPNAHCTSPRRIRGSCSTICTACPPVTRIAS